MRWRDRARKDLKNFGIEEGSWYRAAQERASWRERCCAGLEDATEKRVQEDEMRKRKKSAERSSEVSSQLGEATALPFKCYTSLVPRLLCVGGEKRAWYTLFAHAQFP